MKSASDYDWDEIRDALVAFVEHLEKTEPAAVNTIALFRQAAEECPAPDDFT